MADGDAAVLEVERRLDQIKPADIAIATHLRHKDLQTASRYIDRRGSSSRAISAL